MIRVRFQPGEGGRFRRSVWLPTRDEPLLDEVEIPLDLYPGKTSPVGKGLHEREPEELRAMGGRIAELALGSEGLAALQELRRGGAPVRIAFEEATEAAAAAAVPWELMHDGEEFLAAHPRVHLVRTAADGPLLDAVTTRRPLRLLLLWASPRDQPSVDIEWEQIRLALGFGPHLTRHEIETFEVLHTTRARLDDALATGAYDLVYYTGHGTFRDGTGHLCLEADDGTSDFLSATQFARKLARLGRPPSLVFLNCCWSGAVDKDLRAPGRFLDVGRRLLREDVPFVVATLTPVLVSTAQTFVEAFLAALLPGQNLEVERAMAATRSAVLEETSLDREARQTFFQYLLLTATQADWSHTWEEAEARDAGLDRILYQSTEYPGHDPARVRRNQLLVRVEAAWAQGNRAVGVHGLGGIGKTVFSAQVLERAVGHAVPGLRAERAVWLDLREMEDLHGSLIGQLCFVLDQAGDPATAQALRTTVEPDPVGVARSLAQALGADCVLALDNCETLLSEDGEPSEGPARELVAALVRHTGWRSLLTSREPFSLARDGRDPAPIRWLAVEELTPAERGALLRSALRRTDLKLKDFPPGTQRRIFQEVAGHPFELGLFLGDPRATTDPEGLIDEVHRQTGEYARLGYYVGRVPTEDLPVLHLVAALDEPLAEPVLEALWSLLVEPMGWPPAESGPKGTLAELARRGLVEVRDGSYGVLPVLARFLRAPESKHALPAARQRLLHRELAEAFSGLSEGAREKARNLHAKGELPGPELDAAMAALSRLRLDFLHRAFRHARQQEEVELTLRLAEKLFDTAAGGLPLSRLFAYARELEALLDTKVSEADAGAPPAVAGHGYFVVGKALTDLRRWEEALQAYEKSLAVCSRTDHKGAIGVVHHQIGMVHQERREWVPALESYRQSIEWTQKTSQPYQLGNTYHQIGMVHQERREWEPALESYREAVEWNQMAGQLHHLGSTYREIGMVYQKQREWERALESYRQALEWSHKTGQIHQLGMTYHGIGTAHQEQRKWEPALESYRQAIEWKQKTGQLYQLGTTFHHIGMVHQKQREWEPALESYRQAIEWKQRTGQIQQIGVTYLQIGSVHQERREWEPAFESYRQALEWNQKTGQIQLLGSTFHQIGRLHQERREWEAALESYRQAIEWKQKSGQFHQIGATFDYIGRVYQQRGALQEAGSFYLEALDLYARHGFAHPDEVLRTLYVMERMLAGSDLDDGLRAELREALDDLLRENQVLAQAREALEQREVKDESSSGG